MNLYKLNDEGSFSITRPYESSQIINIMENLIGNLNNKIITDATSCMGGDLINFCNVYKHVNGIEIDENNFECLVENCKRFNCLNVNLFCQDYLEIFNKLKQDVIYIDPPWGGINYKSKNNVKLKINNIDLNIIINNIITNNITKYIFIKVPNNALLDDMKFSYIIPIFNKNKSVSFKLIIIQL